MKIILKLTCLLLYTSTVFASGAYDNGKSTGKGKFKFDITLNPFNKFEHGQSYIVGSYGITTTIDFHGYYSSHNNKYNTWYLGIFYQFLKTKNVDLATAVGIRKKDEMEWTDIFAPQLLYSIQLSNNYYLGGSIVNVIRKDSKTIYKPALDIGLFRDLNYENKIIEKISIGISAFRPATWTPKTLFIPAYSIDFAFK